MARKLGSKDKKKRKSRIKGTIVRVNLNADSAYYRSSSVRISSK